MIKVFQSSSPKFGRGIQRVIKAIEEHAPTGRVEFVDDWSDADLVIHHVIGVQNVHPTKTIDQMVEGAHPGQRHAVLQYCLGSTEQPDPVWWYQHVWSHCDAVWSYYDLHAILALRPTWINAGSDWNRRFYEAPLGVDPVFHGSPHDRPKAPIYLCCTSGYVPETEGVLEVVEAARRVGGRVLHLGPASLDLGEHVSYAEGISDEQLAALYKSCKFVAGLRRVEGFELPAAEGLCGGAIPICFDQPHYRRWFEGAAFYVSEGPVDEVTIALEDLFRQELRARLDPVDVALAQRKFSWPRVVGGFWARIFKESPDGAV